MITLNPPVPADRSFLIDTACDYVQESLIAHGTLPPSPLIAAHTLPLIIRKDHRRIGALATVTGTTEQGDRSEIHAIYIEPRRRGKGHGTEALSEFIRNAPHTPYVLGPMTAPLEAVVNGLEIRSGVPDQSEELTRMATDAFMNTIRCPHQEHTPCRICVVSEIRSYSVKAYDFLSHLVPKKGPTP